MNLTRISRAGLALWMGGALLFGSSAAANSGAEQIEQLKRQVELLEQRDAEKEKQIQELRRLVEELRQRPAIEATAELSPLDRAVEEARREAPEAPLQSASRQAGPATLRLVDVSVNALTAVGASSANDDILGLLQGGAHDPRERGFNLQQAEFSFSGAVDPWFLGEAHVVADDDHVELEEAFITTTALPGGLEIKAGYFLTEFGRINPTHPHAWRWMDQPVVNTRFFGPEGMRGVGARAGWLLPVSWHSELSFGIQNADDESMVSFLGEGHAHSDGHAHEAHDDEHAPVFGETTVGGWPIAQRRTRSLEDLLYLLRWQNGGELSDTWNAQLGFSLLHGPNLSGPDGETWIYGADLVVKWRPVDHYNGWPFLVWESEIMQRRYRADGFALLLEHHHDGEDDDEDELLRFGGRTLKDWGFYTQLLWGWRKDWAVGLRYEYADGRGEDLLAHREDNPLRDERHRLSPLLVWHPSEFSRLRLQYNYDQAEFLGRSDSEHTVWFGLEVLWGSHPAHKY